MEICDPLLGNLKDDTEKKKIILGLVSLVVGFLLSWLAGVRVLQPFGVTAIGIVDILTTALVISAGTEGLNSVMKFIGYGKEVKKAEAEA